MWKMKEMFMQAERELSSFYHIEEILNFGRGFDNFQTNAVS